MCRYTWYHAGDKKAQWANFEQKKLAPFNFRVQLSGSDLKNQIEHDPSTDNSKDETDHDIQQLVAEEDKETKQYQKKSEDESAHAHTPDIHDNGAAGEEDAEKKQEAKIEYKVRSEGVKIGQSSDFWNNYELDIELARDLGEHSTITSPCKCLRMFSKKA